LRGPLARALAAAGRQSLHVFCVGLFLSYGMAVLFRVLGWSLWLEALVVAGCVALLGFASLSEGTPRLTRALKARRIQTP